MVSDFPRTYTIVRRGREQEIITGDREQLIALRTELEVVRRFGAGADHRAIAALDERLSRLWGEGPPPSRSTTRLIESVEEMRDILCDALSPVNAATAARIDRQDPGLRSELIMDSIDGDSQNFRKDLARQLEASGAEDVDAMLAAFEEALKDPPVTGAEGEATSADDEAIDAMLAEAAIEGIEVPPEPELGEIVSDPVDALNDSPGPDQAEAGLEDLVAEAALEQLAAEAAQPPVIPPQADEPAPAECEAPPPAAEAVAADTLAEAAVEQVAETLVEAEEQLDAIASAFEVAAAELDSVTGEVKLTVGSPAPEPEPLCEDATDVAAIQAWENQSLPEESAGLVEAAGLQASPDGAPAAASAPAGSPSPSPVATGGMRAQLQQARANILSELDDLLVMIERVDRMQSQADQAMRKAQDCERAAGRAHEARPALVNAEAEAAKARASFQAAEQRVNLAREAWDQAQQQAAAAAAEARDLVIRP